MSNSTRWKQRFQNFEKALIVFKDRCSDVNEHPKGAKYHDAFQMALVQAFEILIELSWKVLKDYLENEGYTEVQTGKRAVRQAFQDGMIENGELWLKALEMRNLTSHVYDVALLEDITVFVVENFLPEVEKLHNTLQAELQRMRYGLSEEHIKIIVDYLTQYTEIDEAVLFGSRALGTYKPGSDVDIALKGEKVDSFLAAHLKSEIEDETCLPYFFDFVAYSKLTHKDLIKHIDEHGVVLKL